MRPSWDEYFLKLAMLASERATCPRMHCGCVLVKDKYVLSTGYNGSLPGLAHCEDVGCLIVEGHCVRTNHAEMNALAQAASHGVNISNSTLYCTNSPCIICTKMLINAGISKVVYLEGYPDELSVAMLAEAGVEVSVFAGSESRLPGESL